MRISFHMPKTLFSDVFDPPLKILAVSMDIIVPAYDDRFNEPHTHRLENAGHEIV